MDEDKCIGCGKCEKLCPMNNIRIVDKKVVQNNQCTMCYRCINNCPKQAMTLLGKKIVEQSYKYYNEFMWKSRYAECISVAETIERMKG